MHPSALVRLASAALLGLIAAPAARAFDLPYVGTLTSTATAVTPVSPTAVRLDTTLAGRGTALGSFTGTAAYDVDLATGIFTGTLTKATPAGDVREAFVGQFNADFTESVGLFWITGGTGKFKKAGGGGLFHGEVTSAATVDILYLGVLSAGR